MNCLLRSEGILHPIHRNLQFVRYKTNKPIPEFGKATHLYNNVPDLTKNPQFEEGEFLPRKLTYWPPDLKQHRPRDRTRPWHKIKGHITLIPPPIVNRPEFTSEPQYPPCDDFIINCRDAAERKDRRRWYKQIEAAPSVEEKMYKITSEHALRSIHIKSWSHLYDFLPNYQNMTRTHVMNQLPPGYSLDGTDSGDVSGAMVDAVLDAIRFASSPEHEKAVGRYKFQTVQPRVILEDLTAQDNLVEDISRILLKGCSLPVNHAIDRNPHIASYWFCGDMDLPNRSPFFAARGDKGSNQSIQFNDSSIMNIRTKDPLMQVPEWNESVMRFTSNRTNPFQSGHMMKWNRLTSTAGYWPDSEDLSDPEGAHSFPFLTINSLSSFKTRQYVNKQDLSDVVDAITAMALMTSFAWCNSLSFHHGFTPFQEMTYPLTTQAIFTDGKTWTFFVYQFNSHSFHDDLWNKENPVRTNVCWKSDPMSLYDSINEDGSFTGLNLDVLKLATKFMNQPTAPATYELYPYLGQDTRGQEEVEKTRFFLRRYFAQTKTRAERFLVERAKTLPYEWIYGFRNPHSGKQINWREAPKFYDRLQISRKRFTV